VLVLYENFAADPDRATVSVLDQLDLEPPGFSLQPRMRAQ
jgi:hypothetical protein